MILNPSASPVTVGQVRNVTGKVLAISPDGKKVIVYDGVSIPNLLFVFDTTSNSNVTFPISGVTGADFSPDSVKAYIAAGSILYVYSTIEGLSSVPLNGPTGEVSFFPEGAFVYLAGGDAAPGVTVRRTCDSALAKNSSNVDQVIPTPTTPVFLRAVPNSAQVLGVESPSTGIDVINVTELVATDLCTSGVPPNPNINNSAVTTVNLGQGSFTPTQFFLDSGSNRAYMLTSGLANVLVYDIAGQTSSAILLAGTTSPIQASLTSDNTLLYVAAKDAKVHELNTSVGGDVAQIPMPESLCSDDSLACIPDLIAVKP